MPGAALLASLAGDAARLVEDLRRSVVLVRGTDGHGAGTIWESDGLIVTNHHVLPRDRAEVELADGRRLPARVIARDTRNDLVALRVPAWGLPAVLVGDARALRVGEIVFAVGHPFGVRDSATLGIVSAVGRPDWARGTSRELLQADLALAPGSSGGPLVDAGGRVLGIASMVVSPGVAVAIPSHVVCRFLASGLGQPGIQV